MLASVAFQPPTLPLALRSSHRPLKLRRTRPRPERPRTAVWAALSGRDSSTTAGRKSDRAPGPLPAGSRAALAGSGAVLLAGGLLPAALAVSRSEELSLYASHYEMLLLLAGFGVLHSGLASLRPLATRVVGERLYRVLFAAASLPSAGWTIAYFIAHRYDGPMLWALQGMPWARGCVAAVTVLSFFLLYPATFDLPQVAAVRRPRLTIFEEGVVRISRHPQLWGQVLWCAAHCLWLGSSFAIVASAGLIAHHLFGVWNGDRRLRDEFGETWTEYAERTSVVPFAAVVDGKQKLDLREFARPAYVGVALFVWAAYAAHPAMLRLVGEMHL